MKKNNVKNIALVITAIAIICKLVGFVREIILSNYYGTTYILDAYLTATAIPGIYFGWMNSFAVSYTPLYYEYKNKKDEIGIRKFTNTILCISVFLSIICSIIAVVHAELLVSFAVPGYTGEVRALTIHYFKFAVWIIAANIPVKILTSFLNCNDRFVLSNLSTLVISVTEIAVILLSVTYGAEIMIWGVVLADYFQLFVLIYFSRKIGHRFKFEISFSQSLKDMLKMTIPIFVGDMFVEISSYFDQLFASFLDEGNVSALHYSVKIRVFLYYIFNTAITTIVFPKLANYLALNKIDNAKNVLKKSLRYIFIIFMPVTTGAIILAKPAIMFVFEHGAFDKQSTLLTVSPFCMYVLGLLPIATRDILTKMFYAMKDTKTVTAISVLSIGINISFNYILIGPMKQSGLALATTLSIALVLPVFFYALQKKVGNIFDIDSIKFILKVLVATAIMGVIVFSLYRVLETFEILKLVTCCIMGGFVYGLGLLLLKVQEVADILKLSFRWRK